jgi:hypothetical protein
VIAGLVFEYVHLQHIDANRDDGHIIYFNKFYGNIAELVFRHCEVSGGVRGLFRSVKPANVRLQPIPPKKSYIVVAVI